MISGPRVGRPSTLRGWFASTLSRGLNVFVVPGLEILHARGLNLAEAGVREVANPRYASVLLLVGDIPPGLARAAAVAYAQQPRPRAILALGTSSPAPLPAALALAGVPPLAGFWSKDAIEAATIQAALAALLLPLALAGSALTGAYVAHALSLLWFGSAERRSVPGLGWMMLGLSSLTVLAASLGLALRPIAQLVGEPLPDNLTARALGLVATLLGLAAGWSGLAVRLVAPIAAPAARGFRLGNGWIDISVRPALFIARTCDRLERELYALSPAVGRLALRLATGPLRWTDAAVEAGVVAIGGGGLSLARAGRRFDEAELDGLIAQLVRGARALAARARRLQSGFVPRELVLAAFGAAAVFVLALAAR